MIATDSFRSEAGQKRLLRLGVAAGCLTAIAVCTAVATRALVIGSFEGRWFYGYWQGPTSKAFLVASVASVSAAALVLASSRTTRHRTMLTVWMVAGLGLQGLIRTTAPASLESIFVSDAANSFYSVARTHEASDLLSRFNRIRARGPLHARSNMPGKALLIRGLTSISERPDVLPWLVVAVSNLGAALMFAFVREVYGDSRTALLAAILYLFVPAKQFFFPLMNTVTPVAALALSYVFIRWLNTSRTRYPLLFGATLYGLAFFEPLPLVLGLLFAALALRAIALRTITAPRFILQSALAVVTAVAVSEAVYLATGFEIVRAFRQIGAHAVEFNAIEARPYWTWVRANPVEFLFGMGPAQAVIGAGALFAALAAGGSWRDRMTHPTTIICVGAVAVLAVTNMLGVNRGEVIRLWIFLACLFQIPVAWACSKLQSPVPGALVVSLSIVQATLGTSMIAFVVP
jgi:hypothetical protein